MLVASKTITFDHGETQPAGGIVPRFIDSRLLYMLLHLYPDARGMYEQLKELQFGLITLIDSNLIFCPISWNGKTEQVIIEDSYSHRCGSDQWNGEGTVNLLRATHFQNESGNYILLKFICLNNLILHNLPQTIRLYSFNYHRQARWCGLKQKPIYSSQIPPKCGYKFQFKLLFSWKELFKWMNFWSLMMTNGKQLSATSRIWQAL